MLGLFGNLDMAARALQANAQGMEVAGHNLANVNNPAYARQRVSLQTSLPIKDSRLGAQGTGADIAGITQIRDSLLDEQIRVETSARGALDAEQQGLQYAQAGLGQDVNTGAAGANGAAAAGASLAKMASPRGWPNCSRAFKGWPPIPLRSPSVRFSPPRRRISPRSSIKPPPA